MITRRTHFKKIIGESRINDIDKFIKELELYKWVEMNQYSKEEFLYIIHLLESKRKDIINWELESNGTAEDLSTITKFRKIESVR